MKNSEAVMDIAKRLVELTVGDLRRILDEQFVDTSKPMLNTEEAAALMGFKACTIRDMASRRIIPYYKLENGAVRYSREELLQWMRRNRVATDYELRSMASSKSRDIIKNII